MMSQDDQLQSIQQKISKLAEKPALTRGDFLSLAQEAIVAYNESPANREQIARIMTGVWMGFEEVQEDDVMNEIGGKFADLELPDGHIVLEDAESVEEMWQNLAKEIERVKETMINHKVQPY